jgi:hypothetical protein
VLARAGLEITAIGISANAAPAALHNFLRVSFVLIVFPFENDISFSARASIA